MEESKIFIVKNVLKHLAIEGKDFICDKCSPKFCQIADLKEHMKMVYEGRLDFEWVVP